MTNPCSEWEQWIGGDRPAVEATHRDHLDSCPTCRDQWMAHLAFSELGDLPAPELSADLGPRVRGALANLGPSSMHSATTRRVMRVYWLLATFGAGLVLSQLDSSAATWLGLALGLGALVVAATPALMLLRRHFSWGLMDLLVWTLR